jgi:hypothetical protein
MFLSLAAGTMQVLHDRLLDKVLSLPMSFFDTQPSGRLISRFSKDVQSTDLTLPGLMLGLSDCIIGTIVSTAVVAGTTRGAVLAAVGLLVPMYMSIQRKYLATSRELNRLQSVTSSPILTNFGETLAGLITVRAFGKQVRLVSSDCVCSYCFRIGYACTLCSLLLFAPSGMPCFAVLLVLAFWPLIVTHALACSHTRTRTRTLTRTQKSFFLIIVSMNMYGSFLPCIKWWCSD